MEFPISMPRAIKRRRKPTCFLLLGMLIALVFIIQLFVFTLSKDEGHQPDEFLNKEEQEVKEKHKALAFTAKSGGAEPTVNSGPALSNKENLLSYFGEGNTVDELVIHLSDDELLCYGERYSYELSDFVDNVKKLRDHFLHVGIYEGRNPSCSQEAQKALASQRLQTTHVHIVIRTYDKQVVNIVSCLGSMFAAAQGRFHWLRLSISILNTGNSGSTHYLLVETVEGAANILNKYLETKIHVETRPWVREDSSTYGYVASDMELYRLQTLDQNERPDFVIFCNGDTVYTEDFFDSAQWYIEKKIGMIGLNFLPSDRHRGLDLPVTTVKECAFEHGGVDLNGVIINMQALIDSRASFAALHTPCGTVDSLSNGSGCNAVDARPYFVADWGLFSQLKSNGVSFVCLHSRPLYVQN